MTVQEYNEIPVFYCSKCLSLHIRNIGEIDYCESCGSTEIRETTITEWDKNYEAKHGIKFINN